MSQLCVLACVDNVRAVVVARTNSELINNYIGGILGNLIDAVNAVTNALAANRC